MNKIIQAAQFATKAHEGQKRKYSGEDYIYHPMDVASYATLYPAATEEVVCAAWLHDVLEDCNVKEQELLDTFGLEITNIVIGLTNPSKNYPDLPREQRKRMDREYLASQQKNVHVIKCIDRMCNLSDLGIDIVFNNAPIPFALTYIDETILLIECLNKAGDGCRIVLNKTIITVREAIAEKQKRDEEDKKLAEASSLLGKSAEPFDGGCKLILDIIEKRKPKSNADKP